MAKLWAKDYQLNTLIEEFTIGRDHILDQALIPADCLASLAHGRGLESIGVLTAQEMETLKSGLIQILTSWQKGEFVVQKDDEDGHTAIENKLIDLHGDVGKKIHTGRSRNDQVITAIRVYGRSFLLEIRESLNHLISTLLNFAEDNKNVPMPGRTHMQIAMPSSVGLWAAAFAEELADQAELLEGVYKIWNQNPLGSAASYGVPLPLNRDLTGKLMGFPRVQNNVLYVNNSRGKMEAMVLDILDSIGLTLSKSSQDLILFSLPEFGYFSLPAELCSGSSIMPQKKNPDGLELMRGKSASLSAYSMQIKNVLRSLPSGYNRDFQETKEPFLYGLELALGMIAVTQLTFQELKVNEAALKKAFVPEIYATDAALKLVAGGASFRDAYKEVGMNLEKYQEGDPVDSLKNRTYSGTAGNLNLEPTKAKIEVTTQKIDEDKAALEKAFLGLTGLQIDSLKLSYVPAD